MKSESGLVKLLALACLTPVAVVLITLHGRIGVARLRPEGPCDIYAAAGDPCVAAHSSTRALYAAYSGPLYRVMRQSDGKSLDVGTVAPTDSDPGGYADASAQDAFCADTFCWITTVYDQSGHGNNLVQAPRGGFSGPAMGGFNNLPVADWAPVTVRGHKAYGVFIAPGMGLRWNNAKGTAVDDQAEGQYWVVNGHHYNGGCCFDYGNAETDSRDDGDGTMETTYFGNATPWYHGAPPGPWVMTDQENNLVGGYNPDGSKYIPTLPSIDWRFVTGIAKGEPHHWTSMGGDAQRGDLKVMYDGRRIGPSYDPMRKQGAILLGNGGDNSNGSQGTFYEGAMTAGGTFPSDATDQRVQANVVAAMYDVARLGLAPAEATEAPPGIQTFAPQTSQDATLTFTNTSRTPVSGLRLWLSVPRGWSAHPAGAKTSLSLPDAIAPGATASVTFKVTSGRANFNGDIVGKASWTEDGRIRSETAPEKVRNVNSVKINEFAINGTDSFIELYNAGGTPVNLSNWTLTQHPTQQAIFSAIRLPAGAKLAPKGFYVLGLSDSGTSVSVQKGESTLYVRSTTGMKVGDSIQIDVGSALETRKIVSLGTPSGITATVWQPLPDGPVVTIPPGATNIPFAGPGGFGGGPAFTVEVGDKIAIGYGATGPAVSRTMERFEVATVTAVGKPGTQSYLSADAKAGDTSITVRNPADISAGDKITLDIDSTGHGIETVTVTGVTAASPNPAPAGRFAVRGGTLTLAAPLKFNHASNMPFSDRGTGISFTPATAFAHTSNEPVQMLGTGIRLDRPLDRSHDINAVVRDAGVTTAGYQGPPTPNQWFGGPALSPAAGSMVLRNSAGLVVDSLNYGGLVDPWAAMGYQGKSPGNGCSAPSPSAGRGFGGPGRASGPGPIRSAGRYPDGADSGSNCGDFFVQVATLLALDAPAGGSNLKVSSVADLAAGQTLEVDTGANRESGVIASVGTAGGTTINAATTAGATRIPVANVTGFTIGQTVSIDAGSKLESAVIGFITGFRSFGPGPRVPSITVSEPLRYAHAADAPVSGSGITLTAPLTKSHSAGAQAGGPGPTPGAPNVYRKQ